MVGAGQAEVPRPYPRRTGERNSGEDLGRAMLTSHRQRDEKRRKDHLSPGGCREHSRSSGSHVRGKSYARPCKGVRSPSPEGPRRPPHPASQPKQRPLGFLSDGASGWRARGDASRPGSQDKGPRALALPTNTPKRVPKVLLLSVRPQTPAGRIFWEVAPAPPVHRRFPGQGRGPAEQRGNSLSRTRTRW